MSTYLANSEISACLWRLLQCVSVVHMIFMLYRIWADIQL